MKIVRLALVASTLAALVGAPEVTAQVDLEITPFGGGAFFLADPPNRFALHRGQNAPLIVDEGRFDDAWTAGMNVGVRVNEDWGFEGMFSWIPTKLSAQDGITGKEDVNGYMYGVTALYYIPLDGPARPFLGLGAGGETFDYETESIETHHEFMGNVVGGLFVALDDRIGVRLEARDCFARFDSGLAAVDHAWENDLMVTMGLSFRTALGR